MNVSVEMFTYANELGQEKRIAPTGDIVTAIVNAEVDGEQLSEMEFDMFFMLLSVAGNETTRNAITHGMMAFLEYPEQWKRLCAQPELFDTAAEEIVRWASPVIYFRRSVTHNTELRGQQLKAGDKITVWYPSANRDDDIFDNPFEFDIGRDPNPHVGLGGPGVRTSASAPTSPGSRSRRSSRRAHSERVPRHRRGRLAGAAALQLHPRHQARLPFEVVRLTT
jgi:cholest-4-en-3-one 26-monooxygenase